MKILIKGYYGFGNLGDDILMASVYHLLKVKFPNAQFYIFSNFNENLNGFTRQQNYNQYIVTILNEQVQIIDWTDKGHFDLVIDGGGGIYFDASRGTMMRKLLNFFAKSVGLKRLYEFDELIRKILRKPRHITFNKRVAFGIGIGPYTDRSKLLYQNLVDIGSTDLLFVRDNASLKFLKSVKYSGINSLGADVAFLSDHWLPGQLGAREKFQNRVGIVLMDWPKGSQVQFKVFKKFADLQINEGKKITFFSFDENHDTQFIREFKDDYNLIVWRPNQVSLSQFLKALSLQDVLFSARAHGVIAGALLGVPTITIATSMKLKEISKLFPVSTLLIDIPTTEEQLSLQLNKVVINYSGFLQFLKQDILKNKLLAANSWAEFSKQL